MKRRSLGESRTIQEFPDYAVNIWGEVFNIFNEKVLAYKINQYGVVNVGMMLDGIQYNRSVPLLVANEFIEKQFPAFDTPINKDGDRTNNHVDNLVWRPRWFAVRYNQQFNGPVLNRINNVIVDMESGQEYQDSRSVAIHNGLLEIDVVLSILNNNPVWPSYQRFLVLE